MLYCINKSNHASGEERPINIAESSHFPAVLVRGYRFDVPVLPTRVESIRPMPVLCLSGRLIETIFRGWRHRQTHVESQISSQVVHWIALIVYDRIGTREECIVWKYVLVFCLNKPHCNIGWILLLNWSFHIILKNVYSVMQSNSSLFHQSKDFLSRQKCYQNNWFLDDFFQNCALSYKSRKIFTNLRYVSNNEVYLCFCFISNSLALVCLFSNTQLFG